jgi:hypothetical protein
VIELIDARSSRLVADPDDPPHVEPTEVLVLVGAVLADGTTRLLGPGLGDATSAWLAHRAMLRAAADAVLSNDPQVWQNYVDQLEE